MQGVGPLTFPARLEKGIDPANSVRMKTVCVQNMQMQAKMQIVLSRAWKALTEAGMQPVLMKGLGLAQYYPEPSMRQWSDIDLFVGKALYHSACAAMRTAFPEALKFDEELEHYKHYNLIADGVAIEIHRVSVALTHPRDIRRYAKMERFGMAHAIPLKYINTDTHADGAINIDKEEIKNEIVVPEVTFNVLLVFLHSWEHFLTAGANIRQLCDLALLLHHERERIDRVRLKRWLRELRLTEPWQLYMWILKEYLGLEDEWVSGLADEGMLDFRLQIADCRLEEKAEALMEAIMEGRRPLSGSPLKGGEKSTNRFVRKWRTMKKRMRNAERIAEISPAYARHMKAAVWLSGLSRLFAPDRRWE